MSLLLNGFVTDRVLNSVVQRLEKARRSCFILFLSKPEYYFREEENTKKNHQAMLSSTNVI